MADRFPLIANSSANQIQELASGDTLVLTGNNLSVGGDVSIGGTLTYEDVTNIDSVGIVTARAGVNVSGGQIQVGAAFSVGPAGVVTATSYYGDGSNLSNITSTTINSNADNRLITGSGTANTLNGETTLTYDGTNLDLTDNKKIRLGTGQDLEIYHDTSGWNALKSPTHNFIRLATDGGVWIWDTDMSDGYVAKFDPGSTNTVEFKDTTYNTRLQVVEGGVLVTGVSTATGGHITGGGEFKVGTGLTVASTSGVATFAQDVGFRGAGGKDVQWDTSDGALDFYDNTKAKFGNSGDFSIWHDGSNTYLTNTTGNLYIQAKSGENAILIVPDAGTDLYHNGNTKFQTTNDGTVTTGISTFTAGANFDGILSEKFNTVAGKLSDNTTIDLEDGMIHYFSTQETTTSTPNIRYSSSKTLNNMLSIGDSVAITIITTAATAGYSANLNINGVQQTVEWIGGSAPSEGGGSDGLDILIYNILKTAANTYKIIGNHTNATN
jgi:hypothetical protein